MEYKRFENVKLSFLINISVQILAYIFNKY